MSVDAALQLTGAAAFNGSLVFDGLDLTVSAGEWPVLFGPSGVGKSTVLKLFAGLARSIEMTGELRDPAGPLAGRVTLMAQDDFLTPWLSALDKILIGARPRGDKPDRTRALERLAQVGLADKADAFPHALSGRQRQRVALARTSTEDRPVNPLDEPFSALDALTRAQMRELATQLLAGHIVLLVTHDPAEAVRVGHHIFYMTPTGLRTVPTPAGDIPRPVNAPEILAAKADP